MQIHPWHNVHFGHLAPQKVTALIEIQRGSRAKYEVDKTSGLLKLDRVLYSAVYYPANYGFIPQTYAGDNDPLDILVLSQIDLQPLSIVEAKVIGVLRMKDNDAIDDKILAVAANDMSVAHVNDIDDLPKHFLKELRHFFEEYSKLENNEIVIVNEILNAAHAYQIIQQAIDDYASGKWKK
ncbi:MAG: inorganic diphosphatase [Bacteroidia bacterium]|nr:inorganic diphosphatase [Bacteroidia bacterium]